MIVVTAGTYEYAGIILGQARVCNNLGYDHIIYDLGGLGYGIPYQAKSGDLKPRYGQSLPPATFKADLVARHLKGGGIVCWLDGDCLPLQGFIPPGQWDAAVTLRPLPEIGRGRNRHTAYLNSGVVWIRNPEFCEAWAAKSQEMNTDQGALNEIVAPGIGRSEWRMAMGATIINRIGHSISVLNADEWNCWNFPPGQDARILHFKRDRRERALEYL